jgi:hypothetical protein
MKESEMSETAGLTIKTVAAELNGSEYPLRTTKEQRSAWKAAGIVVVYGASDDLMEFDGAINDEFGAPDSVYVDATGLTGDFNGLCEIKNFQGLKRYFETLQTRREIEAVWDVEGYSWIYLTRIPHETFEVMDEGEKYCRGIVFALADVTP